MSSAAPDAEDTGGEMPKDRSEVQDQYKIEGGFLNEYEFDQGKGEMEEQERRTPEGAHAEGLHGADEPNAPQNVAERIRQVEQRAHEIAERRRRKQSTGGAASKGGAGKAPLKSTNAENRAAGKAAKSGSKSAAKGAKKSAKKSAAKSAKKAAKKSAKKAAGGKGLKAGAGKKGASKSAGKKPGGAKKAASKGSKKGAAKRSGSSKKGGGRR
jgi:hypothetical protein